MIHPKLRFCLAACGVATGLLATPTESYGLFHLFRNCCGLFGHRGATTTFAPAAACNPCQQQVVNYVPQTCYRTQCVTVPVTSYCPVTTCDPCTGCPVTTLRPVVNYVRQTRVVPFTTYRPVVSCAPVAPVSFAAPASCGSCAPAFAPGLAAPAHAAPAYAAPAYGVPAAGIPYAPAQPGSGIPTLPPGSSPGTTFENGTQAEGRMRPVPDPEADGPPDEEKKDNGASSGSTSWPRLIDPENRSAAYPVSRAWGFSPVSWPPKGIVARAAEDSNRSDGGGWRASSR
jgi:hypothetical protein